MRINEMIDHLRKSVLIFKQFLSFNFSRKCIEISLENLCLDTVA